MKKLIYIILIVILLALVGMYIKSKKDAEQLTPAVVTSEESTSYDIVDPETGEVVGVSEGNIVTTTTYDDESIDENADGMIIEEDETLIEENPDVTQDDDETIVAE